MINRLTPYRGRNVLRRELPGVTIMHRGLAALALGALGRLVVCWLSVWIDGQQGAQCGLRIERELHAIVLVLVPLAWHAFEHNPAVEPGFLPLWAFRRYEYIVYSAALFKGKPYLDAIHAVTATTPDNVSQL